MPEIVSQAPAMQNSAPRKRTINALMLVSFIDYRAKLSRVIEKGKQSVTLFDNPGHCSMATGVDQCVDSNRGAQNHRALFRNSSKEIDSSFASDEIRKLGVGKSPTSAVQPMNFPCESNV